MQLAAHLRKKIGACMSNNTLLILSETADIWQMVFKENCISDIELRLDLLVLSDILNSYSLSKLRLAYMNCDLIS